MLNSQLHLYLKFKEPLLNIASVIFWRNSLSKLYSLRLSTNDSNDIIVFLVIIFFILSRGRISFEYDLIDAFKALL